MVSKLINKKPHKVHHTIKQTINTLPNLKLTLSSVFNRCMWESKTSLEMKEQGKRKESTWYDDELLKLFPAKWLETQNKNKTNKNKKQNKLTNVQLQSRNRKFIPLNVILQRNSCFLWHSSSWQHAKPLLWNYSAISLTVLYLEVLSSSFYASQRTWFFHLSSQPPDPHSPLNELPQ